MAAIRIETGSKLTTIARGIALAAVLFAGASAAQAADSTDRIIPPNPADVAILRGLLALQRPWLRQGGAAQPVPATTPPALTTEPTQPQTQAPAATEGEACTAPADGSTPTCGLGTEAAATRTAKLGNSFRDSLDRA